VRLLPIPNRRHMTFGPGYKLASSIALILASATVVAQDFHIHKREIPQEYGDVYRFFETIQNPVEPRDAFSAKDAPRWDVPQLMQFVSPNGIRFTDVNHELEGRISAKQIQNALETRKGKVFRAFSHLSHIYSVPYKQYSELTFQSSKDSVVVSVSHWYRLTFDRKGKRPVISKWEYVQLEGE
jgi:hypothetical protein